MRSIGWAVRGARKAKGSGLHQPAGRGGEVPAAEPGEAARRGGSLMPPLSAVLQSGAWACCPSSFLSLLCACVCCAAVCACCGWRTAPGQLRRPGPRHVLAHALPPSSLAALAEKVLFASPCPQIAQSARVPVVLDAGGVDRPLGTDLLSNVTILSPNETELSRLTGGRAGQGGPRAWGRVHTTPMHAVCSMQYMYVVLRRAPVPGRRERGGPAPLLARLGLMCRHALCSESPSGFLPPIPPLPLLYAARPRPHALLDGLISKLQAASKLQPLVSLKTAASRPQTAPHLAPQACPPRARSKCALRPRR